MMCSNQSDKNPVVDLEVSVSVLTKFWPVSQKIT